MVRGAMWAASVLRPNSCLAGVLGSSGLASAGSGRGLTLPLSCADAGMPMADMMRTAQPRMLGSRRASIVGLIVGSMIMGHLGIVLLIRRPATPTHTRCGVGEYVRLAASQPSQELSHGGISGKDRVPSRARIFAGCDHAGRADRLARRADRDARSGRQRHFQAVRGAGAHDLQSEEHTSELQSLRHLV